MAYDEKALWWVFGLAYDKNGGNEACEPKDAHKSQKRSLF